MTKIELISKIINLELEMMSHYDLVDFYRESQETAYYTWSTESLEDYAMGNWPEHFENFEFEQ